MMTSISSPIKQATKHEHFLKCKDYSVSFEEFDLVRDVTADLLITTPSPHSNDLSKYYESDEYISHTDANSSIFDRLYQMVKRYTIKKKINLINQQVKTKSKSILDVGCGTGDFLYACEKDSWECVGLEPNTKARQLASNKLTNSDIFSDIQAIPQEKQFDIITLWHVLEHIPNLETYILFLKQHLKVGGKLIVAVPNFRSYDAQYYGKFWAAYDVPRHLWHFSQKAIAILFSQFDMRVEKTLPMKFDAYYVSLLSENYKNPNSNFLLIKFIKAFFNGFTSNFKAFRSKEYSSLIYLLENN